MHSLQYDHPPVQPGYFVQSPPPMTQRSASDATTNCGPQSPYKDPKPYLPQTPPGALNQAQPLMYSPGQAGLPFVNPNSNLPFSKPQGRKGGWEPVIVLFDSLIILGASLFSFYAQKHHLVVNQGTLAKKILNSSNVSALVSAVGAVVAAVYVWGLGLLGRMWLFRKVSSGGTVELRQLMVIASRGGLNDLHHALRVAGFLFITTIAISWYIPAAFSGALNPTLAKVSERVDGKMTYLQLAGSGGNETIGVASDCAVAGKPCPAKSYYADHYQSLQFAFGYSPYFSSWGAYQNTTPIVATQFGVSSAYGQIDTRKLDSYSSVVSSMACVPLTQPLVSCIVVLDRTDLRITDGEISYDTPCGTTKLKQGGGGSGQGGSVTSTCEMPGNDRMTKFYHTVVADEVDGGTRQLQCDITVQEGFRRVHFWAGDNSWYQDIGACLDQNNTLTHPETRALISSVVYVLQGAAQQLDQASGSDRNPLYQLVDRAMITGNLTQLELMVTNGIQTAASIVYGIGFIESNGTLIKPSYSYLNSEVWYNAYSWGAGWKGYIWASLLLLAGLVGSLISFTALFHPRLGYDPASYAETLFLDKAATLSQDEVDVWTRELPPRHTKFEVALRSR